MRNLNKKRFHRKSSCRYDAHNLTKQKNVVYKRIWYEADINYTGGFRNGHRIVYSNDGLIFVTYDHYNTFYEIN